MKTKMQLSPKVTPKTKLKSTLIYTSVGVALALIIGIGAFFYFNLGDVENAYAASYSSSNTGNWVDGPTWSGSAPGTVNIASSTITINSDYVTRNGSLSFGKDAILNINSGGTLDITGSFSIGKSFQMNINGTLIIRGGLSVAKDADLVVNGDGNIIVYGPATMGKTTTFNINGVVDFKDNLSFDKDATMTVNSNGEVNVGGDLSFDRGANITNNGTINVGNDLTFSDTPNQFDGSGAVNIGGTGCQYWNGSGGCSENSTLPVKLLGFNAEASGDEVVITWETATELNNDHFNIQRSKDGKTYNTITEVKGNGTTNDVSDYSFVDEHPLNGISYYRLKQTDFDGTSETFRPVLVETSVTTNKVEVYPNPLTGNNLNIRRTLTEEGQVNIFDYKGNKVYSEAVNGFDNVVALNVGQELQPGLYYVKYQAGSTEKTVKLIKR